MSPSSWAKAVISSLQGHKTLAHIYAPHHAQPTHLLPHPGNSTSLGELYFKTFLENRYSCFSPQVPLLPTHSHGLANGREISLKWPHSGIQSELRLRLGTRHWPGLSCSWPGSQSLLLESPLWSLSYRLKCQGVSATLPSQPGQQAVCLWRDMVGEGLEADSVIQRSGSLLGTHNVSYLGAIKL